MSLIDLASLVLAPTATKEGKVYSAIPDTGDGDMTFSRGSAATRINSAGLIEKERGNLLTYSNDFSQSIWQKLNNAVVSGQTATDPFGNTNSAWDVVFDGTTSCRIEQSISGVINGGVYASSIWARTKSGTQDVSFGSVFTENFTLTTEWQRISLFEVENDTVAYVRLACNDAVTLEVYAAQLEQGLVATDYIPTTTSAVYEGITDDVPRVDYSGGGCPALKLEPQRTNLIAYSEDFTTRGGLWQTFGNLTKTLFAATSPDGYDTAAHITGLNGDGTNDFRYAFSYNTANKTLTYSVYLKGSGTLRLQMSNGVDQAHNEDITLTSDWKRHSVSGTFNSTSVSTIYLVIDDFIGKTATEYHIWGAQLEEGSYVSSYIPTYSVSSTRVADSCSLSNASNLFNNDTAVWLIDIERMGIDSNDIGDSLTLKDGSNVRQITLWFDAPTEQIRFRDGKNSFTTIGSSGGVISTPAGERKKIALKINGTTLKVFADGVQKGSNYTRPNAFDFTKMDMTGIGYKIKNVQFYTTALTDEECIALTN